MRATGTTGSRFRARKLNTKTPLPILRESDVDGAADQDNLARDAADPLSSLPKFESGVDAKEEREHHLQQVINASHATNVGGKVAQISIPTPDAVASDISYDKLYPPTFVQPATYIRSSSTVEDSTGVPYCMNDDDDEWLQAYNGKGRNQCSEDEFEQLMSTFEETSVARQPYASVDQTPVLSFEEMETSFDETVTVSARRFASDVYEYWKDQRSKNGNRTLMPKLKTLKMETGQEADDGDPYVCFRRREVRQARKTRGRDAQVVEKLKRLRRELEEARQIVYLVKEREMARKQDLMLSRKIFEQRSSVREMKRTLNIQDDDEDLITQRTPKRPPGQARPQVPFGQQPQRPRDSVVSSDTEIVFLRSLLEKQEREVARQINRKVEQHEEWNAKHVDFTEDILKGYMDANEVFLRPEARQEPTSKFAAVRIDQNQLPTPPPSNPASSDDEGDHSNGGANDGTFHFRVDQALERSDFRSEAHVRLRYGRSGRLFMDTHNLNNGADKMDIDVDDRLADRFKYDQDDGDWDSEHDEESQQLRGFFSRSMWQMGEMANDRRMAEKLAAQQRRSSVSNQPAAAAAVSQAAGATQPRKA